MSDLSKRFTIVFGVVLSVAMVASLILPLLMPQTPLQEQIVPTEGPQPTVPPPVENLNTITFNETYQHPSGLFSVAIPSGWTVTNTRSLPNEAAVNTNNGELLSVTETFVMQPAEPVTTAEDLNNIFNAVWMGQSWQRYANWTETGRRVDGDRLIIDFNLSQGRFDYIARHVAWTDGTWVYAVRVVTLDNASQMLLYLLDGLADSLQPNTVYADTPFDWNSYSDTAAGHIIRFPQNWSIVDAAEGQPATISSSGAVLRVEADDTVISDEDAARAWIEAWRSGVTALTVQPAEQADLSGYRVSYRLTSLDGDSESGLALLLNGPDGRLHVANLRTGGEEVDLNSAAAGETHGHLLSVLETFRLLP